MTSHSLHPHSMTHSSTGSSLPNLSHRGGFLGAHENLCFNPQAFAPRGKDAKPFDAHAFVTEALAATNPAFHAQQQIAVGTRDDTKDDGTLIIPAHAASPSVPLELLREHLTSYQLYIKNELIELLNTEYQDFIGLSSSLTGIDTRIASIQSALHTLSNELSTLHRRVSQETLGPFEEKFVSQYWQEKQKRNYIHALMHVLEQMKVCDGLVKENEEEMDASSKEEARSPSASAQHGRNASASTPTNATPAAAIPQGSSRAHTSIVAHHLATAEVNRSQRSQAHGTSRSSKQRTSKHSTNKTAGLYEGLNIDIPLWMIQPGGSTLEDGNDDEEEDDADEEDETDEKSSSAAPTLEQLNHNDAYGLYQALLNVPTSESMYAHSVNSARVGQEPTDGKSLLSTPSSDSLTTLTSTLLRLERLAHSLCSLSTLVASCSEHFHLARDLRNADGVSGSLDRLEARIKSQVKDAVRDVIGMLAATTTGASLAAVPVPPPQLRGFLRSIYHTVSFLDSRSSLLDELLRDGLIQPFLKATVSKTALIPSQISDEATFWNSTTQQKDALKGVYDSVIKFLSGPWKILIDCGRRHYPLVRMDGSTIIASNKTDSNSPTISHDFPLSPFHSSTFLSLFLSEFSTHISQPELKNLLAPGVAHVFLHHYRLTQTFKMELLQYAESMAGARDSSLAENLKSSPAWLQFEKHWNTTLYFLTRQKQIVGALETALAEKAAMVAIERAKVNAPPSPSTNTVPSFEQLQSFSTTLHLPSHRTLWTSLLSCFHLHNFLEELSHKFLKLALQCIQRVRKMDEEHIAQSAGKSSAGTITTANTSMLLILHSDWTVLSQLMKEFLIPFILHERLGVKKIDWTQLRKGLSSSVSGENKAAVSPHTHGAWSSGEPDLTSLIISVFAPSFTAIDSFLASMHSTLVSSTVARSRIHLACVTRLSQNYVAQKVPTKSFRYVRSMVEPLVELLHQADTGDLRSAAPDQDAFDDPQQVLAAGLCEDDNSSLHSPSHTNASSLLHPGDREKLINDVVSKLAHEYESEARNCLTKLADAEKRLKQLGQLAGKKPAANPTANEVSGSEKARRQINLDIAAFVRFIVEQISPPPESLLQPLLQITRA